MNDEKYIPENKGKYILNRSISTGISYYCKSCKRKNAQKLWDKRMNIYSEIENKKNEICQTCYQRLPCKEEIEMISKKNFSKEILRKIYEKTNLITQRRFK